MSAGKACVACRCTEELDPATLKAGTSRTTYILCTDCLTLQERQEFRGCKICWEDVCRCDYEEEGPEEDCEDRESCGCGACESAVVPSGRLTGVSLARRYHPRRCLDGEEHDGREEGWE